MIVKMLSLMLCPAYAYSWFVMIWLTADRLIQLKLYFGDHHILFALGKWSLGRTCRNLAVQAEYSQSRALTVPAPALSRRALVGIMTSPMPSLLPGSRSAPIRNCSKYQ